MKKAGTEKKKVRRSAGRSPQTAVNDSPPKGERRCDKREMRAKQTKSFPSFRNGFKVTVWNRTLSKKESWRQVLILAYQSLGGVLYGDSSTSPLYVYKSAFVDEVTIFACYCQG